MPPARHSCARAASTSSSSAPTASPRTATSATRSAPTRKHSPRRITVCRCMPPCRRPRSTGHCADGTGIPIEERDADEVLFAGAAKVDRAARHRGGQSSVRRHARATVHGHHHRARHLPAGSSCENCSRCSRGTDHPLITINGRLAGRIGDDDRFDVEGRRDQRRRQHLVRRSQAVTDPPRMSTISSAYRAARLRSWRIMSTPTSLSRAMSRSRRRTWCWWAGSSAPVGSSSNR